MPQYGIRKLGRLTLDIQSPGGGGFGDPTRREPARVARDARDGVLSIESARRDYLVVIGDDFILDETETKRLRDNKSARGTAPVYG